MAKHHAADDTAAVGGGPKVKISRVTFVSANTDGKNIFAEVDAFDGEHTNKFYPVFGADAGLDEIKDYMKSLIDESPKLSNELTGFLQGEIYVDPKAPENWMIKTPTEAAVAEKKTKSEKASDK